MMTKSFYDRFLRAIPTILLMTLLVGHAAHAEKSGQIRLNESGTARGSKVLLGDVASIDCSEAADAEALRSLELMDAPKPGESMIFTNEEITRAIRKYSKLITGFQVTIPDKVKITRDGSRVDKASLQRILQQSLAQNLSSWGGSKSWKVNVSAVQSNGYPSLTPTARIRVIMPTSRPKGVTSFQAEVVDKDSVIERFWVQARVEYRTTVPVVTHQLRAGQTIDSNRDVRWEERDITYLQDNPVTVDDLTTLPTVAMMLNPGTILVRSNLQRELAAHRGEELEVIAGNDDFKVSTRGTSDTQGYLGDLVKVKTTNGKTLSGTLVSKGVVRVQY